MLCFVLFFRMNTYAVLICERKEEEVSQCPHLDPQIHMRESDGAEVTRRRRSSPAAQASLPGSDDLLREILLRLPPQPSSLLRASAVCKQWRRLVTDPKFHLQFRTHHGKKPPLLGVFRGRGSVFRSILDPPDRIPPECFDLRRQTGVKADVLGCRHGRVLLMDSPREKVIVCEPITGKCHHIDAPPAFKGLYAYGAVICAATDQDHVHGSCHSSPFKVILMSLYGDKYIYEDKEYSDDSSPIACVYSSETGVWGNLLSTTARCDLTQTNPGVLVGNVLYWSSKCVRASEPCADFYDTDDIIEFDLDRQSLAVIKGPPGLNASLKHQIFQAEDGHVGLAMLSHGGRLKIWQRKVNCHGSGATWLLQKTVEMRTVLGLPPQLEGWMRGMVILGYDEDTGSIFVHLGTNVYMVQLISMQSRKLYKSDCAYNIHPFTSFYAPGGGCDGAEMLPNCLV